MFCILLNSFLITVLLTFTWRRTAVIYAQSILFKQDTLSKVFFMSLVKVYFISHALLKKCQFVHVCANRSLLQAIVWTANHILATKLHPLCTFKHCIFLLSCAVDHKLQESHCPNVRQSLCNTNY